jgi:hypothetical protein
MKNGAPGPGLVQEAPQCTSSTQEDEDTVTIEITAPAKPDHTQLRRMNYMAALSLAETILSETALIPTNFTVECAHFAPNETLLRFCFHRDPASVAKFADERYLEVVTSLHNDGAVYTEARGGLCRGVRVMAWSLMPASEVADAAAVSA